MSRSAVISPVSRLPQRHACRQLLGSLLWATPVVALAQAASPFMTGATALQTNILAWLTPIAVILVMVLGAMAMANRMSWGWCMGADPWHRDRLRRASDRDLGARDVRRLGAA